MVENLGDRAALGVRSPGCRMPALRSSRARRLGPINRKQERQRIAQEFVLFVFAYLTDEFNVARINPGTDVGLEIVPVYSINLGGDPKRNSGPTGYLDRQVRPLLRCDPARNARYLPGPGLNRSRSFGRP